MTDSDHPVFDDTEHHWLKAAAREWASVEEHVADVLHRKTPAQQPATMNTATQQEDSMSLATIADDIKNAIGNAEQWVTQVTETHLPAILAEAGKYEGSTIGKLAATLEGALIPEPFESMLNGLVEDFVKRYGQPAVTAPAEAQPPAEAPAQ